MSFSPAQQMGQRSSELLEGNDERILILAQARLGASGHLLLRRLRCEVIDGLVTVSGTVPTYYLKQVAQTVLVDIEQARGLRNLVQVQ